MMSSLLDSFIQTLQSTPHFGAFIGFLTAFAESLPFVGFFIPAIVILPVFGWLMIQAILPWHSTFLAIVTGALLGDLACYGMGRVGKPSVQPLILKLVGESTLQSGYQILEKHGTLGLVVSKFSGPVRSIATVVSGFLNLSFKKFCTASVPAVLLWSILHITPGLLIGAQGTPFDVFHILQLGSMLVLLTLSLLLGMFSTPLSQICANTLTDTALSPYWQNQLRIGAKTMLASLPLLWLCAHLHHPTIENINHWVYSQCIYLQTSHLVHWSVILATYTNPKSLLALAGVQALLLGLWINQKSALRFLLITVGTFTLGFCIKFMVGFPRPTHIQALLGKFNSFPSGHALMAWSLLYGVEMLGGIQHTVVRFWARIFIIILMLSRIYIGAHWFFDIVGGFLLALTLKNILETAKFAGETPCPTIQATQTTKRIFALTALCYLFLQSLSIFRLFKLSSLAYLVPYSNISPSL